MLLERAPPPGSRRGIRERTSGGLSPIANRPSPSDPPLDDKSSEPVDRLRPCAVQRRNDGGGGTPFSRLQQLLSNRNVDSKGTTPALPSPPARPPHRCCRRRRRLSSRRPSGRGRPWQRGGASRPAMDRTAARPPTAVPCCPWSGRGQQTRPSRLRPPPGKEQTDDAESDGNRSTQFGIRDSHGGSSGICAPLPPATAAAVRWPQAGRARKKRRSKPACAQGGVSTLRLEMVIRAEDSPSSSHLQL